MGRFESNRRFQLWEYRVSHGSLLIRSPRDDEFKTNLDVVLVGVKFLSFPRHIDGLAEVPAEARDIEQANRILGGNVDDASVHAFVSRGSRFLAVAAGMSVSENDMEIFDSPFD